MAVTELAEPYMLLLHDYGKVGLVYGLAEKGDKVFVEDRFTGQAETYPGWVSSIHIIARFATQEAAAMRIILATAAWSNYAKDILAAEATLRTLRGNRIEAWKKALKGE